MRSSTATDAPSSAADGVESPKTIPSGGRKTEKDVRFVGEGKKEEEKSEQRTKEEKEEQLEEEEEKRTS